MDTQKNVLTVNVQALNLQHGHLAIFRLEMAPEGLIE